jgi:predicted O-linked N-acetylglucosamine transferase (SPINDLY family)
MIALWSNLLQRVPGSRLLVVTAILASVLKDFLGRFVREGIARERMELLGSKPFKDYLALHGSVDVMLDTHPYSGGTTTCHSLWMGVPVVTLAGDTATSRGGASLLHAVGLDELIAHSGDEYVAIAGRLASDPDRLATMRTTLRERMRSSPLMGAHRFTRNLEAQFRVMWRSWCERRPDG